MIRILSKCRLKAGVRAAAVVACTATLAACGSLTGSAPPPSPTPASTGGTSEPGNRNVAGFAQFSDIAVPPGAKMNVDRTLVLGNQDAWIGRLSLSTSDSATEAYDFFLRQMPKFGWQEITTVRSETSVLTYARGSRIATIQISPRTLGGTRVDITVSPRGQPGSSTSGASSSSSGNSVTATPLR